MSKMDWARNGDRQRIARYGAEGINGDDLSTRAPPRRRKSKEELRREAEAMLAASTRPILRAIECSGCGRKAEVRIPIAHRNAHLKCSACGTRVQL